MIPGRGTTDFCTLILFVYIYIYIEDIQVFGVNMSFISLSEVKIFYIS